MRDRILGKRVFSLIDLKDAYHRLLIAPEDPEKMAIQTRFGLFKYVVMPFGFCNAPGAFQQLMNRVLGDLYDITVICYLDDILVFSDTPEQHVEHLWKVFTRLREYDLYVNINKCHWAQPEVEFCGHMFSAKGMRISPDKTEIVRNWPLPATTRHIRQFLGLCNYFIDYIEHYAEIAAPLSALQSVKATFIWTLEHHVAFEALKRAIISAPVLATFDPDNHIYVYTDASGYATSGWLGQPHNQQPLPSPLPKLITEMEALPALKPVLFFSRKMLPAETRYPVHGQEHLAL
ncbi:hypothetical protein PhCBS80983_g06523, partial [Powellomyces hirtus]